MLGGTMKRLLTLMLACAAILAMGIAAGTVSARDGSDDDTTTSAQPCDVRHGENEPGDDHGTDSRAIASEDREGTSGDDDQDGTAEDDHVRGHDGDDDERGGGGADDIPGAAGDGGRWGGGGAGHLKGGRGGGVLKGGRGQRTPPG